MSPNAERRALIAYTIATALAVPALMLWADIPVAQFFHVYRDTAWENAFAFITNFANGLIWYTLAVLGLCIAYARGQQERVRVWGFMIAAMASSGVAEITLKFIIGRDRPRFLFRDGAMDFHPFRTAFADNSFPSGHAQSICAAMLSLAVIYPPLRGLFFVTAALVSASRIIIGAHYASDVAGGVWLAVIAVALWRRRFEQSGTALKL